MKKFWIWTISIFLAPGMLALTLGIGYLIILPVSTFLASLGKLINMTSCVLVFMGICLIYLLAMMARVAKDSGFPEMIVNFFARIFTGKK